MKVGIATLISLVFFLKTARAISIQDVYAKLIEKESGYGTRFTDTFIRPVAIIDGQFIWPRSYHRPGALLFDDNGAAYNVRKELPTLREIMARTPLGMNHDRYKFIN